METLESRLAEVVEELEFAGEWNDRYRLLVQWGEEAPQMPEADRLDADLVPGCSSPLWLRVHREAGAIAVSGASPGLLPMALVALLIRLFDGVESAEGTPSLVMDQLDLRRHLSPSRALVFERMLTQALSVAAS